MQDFKHSYQFSKLILALLIISSTLVACKREIVEEVVYDNIIYQIDTVPVYQSNSEKDRLKTPLQYISSLYSNLYYSSIPIINFKCVCKQCTIASVPQTNYSSLR